MPATCSICLESFTAPVSLPCGHVFCRECIRRTVDSIKSCNVQHFCPTCRAPYSILTVDPALIPPYLRPHILPPIRQVFFDNPSPTATAAPGPAPSSSTSSSTVAPSPTAPGPSGDLARAAEDAATLRLHCETWKRRAELHAAANTNLLGFARAVKDCALRLRAERDLERNQCVLLKRKLAELMPDLDPETESPFTQRQGVPMGTVPVARVGLPVFLQCRPSQRFYDNVDPAAADMNQHSRFGPPLKRRRSSPKRRSGNETARIPACPDATAVRASPDAASDGEAGPPRVFVPISDLTVPKRLPTLALGAQ